MARQRRDEFSEPSEFDDDGWDVPSREAEPDDVDAYLDPDVDGDTPPRPRSRRRTALLAAAALTVLAVVTGVLLLGQERDRRTPEAAVQEYVDLIEAGEIEAASAIVPVLGRDIAPSADPDEPNPSSTAVEPGADRTIEVSVLALDREAVPGLLTDASYASNSGLEVISVERLDGEGDAGALPPVGESVRVVVSYLANDSQTSAALRVERAPDRFPGLPSWRILDSLAVPLVVSVPDAGLGDALVDGVSVTANTPDGPAELGTATMLYPGVYTVSFDGGTYLEAADVGRRVASAGRNANPATSHTPAALDVVPSAAAIDLLLAEASRFLRECEVPDADVDRCPEPYRTARAAGGPGVVATITEGTPSGLFIGRSEGNPDPVVVALVDAAVTDPATGAPTTERFSLWATLDLDGPTPTVEVEAVRAGQ